MTVSWSSRQANQPIAGALDENRDVTCVVREPPVVHGSRIMKEPKLTVSWEASP